MVNCYGKIYNTYITVALLQTDTCHVGINESKTKANSQTKDRGKVKGQRIRQKE